MQPLTSNFEAAILSGSDESCDGIQFVHVFSLSKANAAQQFTLASSLKHRKKCREAARAHEAIGEEGGCGSFITMSIFGPDADVRAIDGSIFKTRRLTMDRSLAVLSL